MADPSVVPWVVVWWGFFAAVIGVVMGMAGWGQRQRRAVDTIGGWLVALGVIVMLGTVAVNGVVLIAHAATAAFAQEQSAYPDDLR